MFYEVLGNDCWLTTCTCNSTCKLTGRCHIINKLFYTVQDLINQTVGDDLDHNCNQCIALAGNNHLLVTGGMFFALPVPIPVFFLNKTIV